MMTECKVVLLWVGYLHVECFPKDPSDKDLVFRGHPREVVKPIYRRWVLGRGPQAIGSMLLKSSSCKKVVTKCKFGPTCLLVCRWCFLCTCYAVASTTLPSSQAMLQPILVLNLQNYEPNIFFSFLWGVCVYVCVSKKLLLNPDWDSEA